MYKEYNDFELLDYIAENNEEATNIMYKKYEPLINSKAKKMIKCCQNTGLEINDLIQEGMLGLTNAINSFKDNKETLFYTYAKTCIERKMISAMISSRRYKHKILNDSFSLEKEDKDGNSLNLENVLGDNTDNPEFLIINEENKKEIINKIEKELTTLENQVFELKINGFDYKEIAGLLDKDLKSIDNCLQRIKLKIKKVLKL
ncbi:MAG: sigma-70 family RNA polymerase sigma factor [Bacilli bacterium]|nr:sigma-70 family RNA polymerase sigma factor [Bacilli bacterium]